MGKYWFEWGEKNRGNLWLIVIDKDENEEANQF
jgi:hypothetical protein